MTDTGIRLLLDTFISSAFDPDPIRFRARDEHGVRPVRTACRHPHDAPRKLTRPLPRNAFLCGCLDLVGHEPIEHLIVGLRERRGSTTLVDTVAHVAGRVDSASPPDWLCDAVMARVTDSHQGGAVVVHNYPGHVLHVLLDNLPVASGADRKTLVQAYANPVLSLKAATGGGRLRFYVVENGYVREYRTPMLLNLLGRLQKGCSAS